MNAPTLAGITRHQSGGGVALVTDLLWRVLNRQWSGHASLLTAYEGESHPATTTEKVRFALALARAQALGRTDWVLFSHLGLAKVQNAIPFKRPYGIFLHGIEAWCPLAPDDRRALTNASLRLANSHYTAERIMRAHPDVGPVEVCQLALLPSHFTSSAAPLPFDIGEQVVLVVGRMASGERYKGHDQLIEAWPRVLAAHPRAQLVIVGTGDDLPRLRDKAEPLGQSIVFTGFLSSEALQSMYQHSAVFALPSRGEGFGLVYLEAMAHRLPCLASIHDAASEVVIDGETGVLVDQESIEQIADALTRLLADAELRKKLGDAGWTRLQAHFTFDQFSARLQHLLDTATQTTA